MKALRLAALPALVLALTAWRVHPIHAARVELDIAPSGAVTAVVHVYHDDIPAAIQLPDLSTYFARVMVVTDAKGSRVPLVATAVAPEGDRLRIDLAGTAAAPVSRGHLALTLLQERFPDQVNVVDARVQGRRAQLVFLRGDGPQLLP